MKEFLSTRGVDYRSTNVAVDPAARERLAGYGLRGLPVVADGHTAVYGVNLAAVARLAGFDFQSSPALDPAELVNRARKVLGCALSMARQLRQEDLGQLLPGRDRSLLSLANHIFAIGESFVAVARGADFTGDVAAAEPRPLRPIATLSEQEPALLAGIGLAPTPPLVYTAPVTAYYGTPTLHEVLERCTWHMAQHSRQLMMMMTRLEYAIKQPLAAADLENLPLPESAWD